MSLSNWSSPPKGCHLLRVSWQGPSNHKAGSLSHTKQAPDDGKHLGAAGSYHESLETDCAAREGVGNRANDLSEEEGSPGSKGTMTSFCPALLCYQKVWPVIMWVSLNQASGTLR